MKKVVDIISTTFLFSSKKYLKSVDIIRNA
nr:MAG TPA: hypothetical protein [Caudoviricetes sp.]